MNNILFENQACLVINKRCGEDSQKFFASLKPVHRLDKPASGCLLLAKTKEAAAFLSAALASMEKLYWAIVEKPRNLLLQPDTAGTGGPKLPWEDLTFSGEWLEAVHWINFSAKQNKSIAYNEEKPNTKKALLRWKFVGSGDRYLFFEVKLITGRHHQIRAQFAAMGLHIKGDLKYGARRSDKSGGIRLHARSLRFPNPVKGQTKGLEESILAEAPLPFQDSLWQAFALVT